MSTTPPESDALVGWARLACQYIASAGGRLLRRQDMSHRSLSSQGGSFRSSAPSQGQEAISQCDNYVRIAPIADKNDVAAIKGADHL
jgi:hypothetical protein